MLPIARGERPPQRRFLVASFLAWSLACLPPLALLPPLPALAIAVANGLFILGIAYGNAVYEAVLQREIPPERLSRVSSFDWMVSLLFMPLGQALAGPLADAVGLDVVLIGAATLIVLSCAAGIATPSVRSLAGATAPVRARAPAVAERSRDDRRLRLHADFRANDAAGPRPQVRPGG